MSHRFALPIAILLLAAFFIPSLLGNIRVKGNVTSNIVIQSNGTISGSVRLMGVDHPAWFDVPNGPLVDLVANAGAKAWRQHMISALLTDLSIFEDLKYYLDQRGVKLVIMTCGVDSWEFNFNWQEQADIIMNANGKGDKWITDWGQIIAILNPYAIDVMNEPRGISGTSYESSMTAAQFFSAYRQFCIKCINAWRQIKPDLVCIVANCPFTYAWSDTGFDLNPINLPNIVYSLHWYYAFDNSYPPDYLPDQQAYWDGNFATGKQLLANLIDRYSLSMRNIGCTVSLEEVGANPAAPNAIVYMQDLFDLCAERDIGVIEDALAPYPRAPAGILNEDWATLNALGEVWARNMP